MVSTQVQSALKSYERVHAIERAKPVSGSNLDTHSQNKHFEKQKSFSQVLKEELRKK